MISFNKPFLTGEETFYIEDAVSSGKISGNGKYTKECHSFFESKYGFKKALLTSSCTDALEMAAILCDLRLGDEVIMPAYTFVSTANAFVLRGAKIVFCDSMESHPCMDAEKIESLITEKTKVIVPVHYAGVACDMDKIMRLSKQYNLLVVEDAAQAIDSYYKGKPLGSIGHFGAFSFHETKNIISGEGGMLTINDERFLDRAEIIWEKGTNRSAFWRGEVDKYGWVDIGSSFLPSDITAAFLFAQLENLELIQKRRIEIWDNYWEGFKPLDAKVKLPRLPDYATNNAHMFYLVCNGIQERTALIEFLRKEGVYSVFHYLGLHKSTFYSDKYVVETLENCDQFEEGLVRMPFYYELSDNDQQHVINCVLNFYASVELSH